MTKFAVLRFSGFANYLKENQVCLSITIGPLAQIRKFESVEIHKSTNYDI